MFDDWAWKSYVNVMTEAKEPTPFKSKAQKRYKKLRYKNDIYTRNGGIKNKASGAPYSGDLQRFGTSSLRFESLTEEVIDGLDVSSLKPQDTLSPVLWDGKEIDPHHKMKLISVANDFVDSLGLDIEIKDILLVGSMAGYNYSEHSDVDLHIVLDFGEISTDPELLRKYFFLAKSKWNRNYRVTVGGHDVEVYAEDIGDDPVPSPTYSLMRDEWILEPSKEDVSIDYEGVVKKVKEKVKQIDELQSLHDSGNYEEAYDLSLAMKTKLRNFRKSGLDESGEFSIENLAYKILRRSGEIERVADILKKSYTSMREDDGI